MMTESEIHLLTDDRQKPTGLHTHTCIYFQGVGPLQNCDAGLPVFMQCLGFALLVECGICMVINMVLV